MQQRGLYISKEQIEELEHARKQNKNKKVDRRIRAVIMHAQGVNHKTISEHTEYASTYVGELVAKYVDGGLSAITGNNHKGNRRNISFEEEEALLAGFRDKAGQGKIVEVSDIRAAYENAVGHSPDKSSGQIYKVLKRHGWRKVMPRGKHPDKANDGAIEASKKLTMPSEAKRKILLTDVSG